MSMNPDTPPRAPQQEVPSHFVLLERRDPTPEEAEKGIESVEIYGSTVPYTEPEPAPRAGQAQPPSDDVLRRASIAADAIITEIFGWPWRGDAQKLYAKVVDAMCDIAEAYAAERLRQAEQRKIALRKGKA